MSHLTRLMDSFTNDTRIKMIKTLASHGTMTVTELSKELNITLVMASAQLSILAKLGLVDSVREGKYVNYFLSNHTLRDKVVTYNFDGIEVRIKI